MILNRQRLVSVSTRRLEEFLVRLRRALRLSEESLTVCLVTDATIARWNREYRGKREPTDVLSFPANGTEKGLRPGKGARGAGKQGGQSKRSRFAGVRAREFAPYLGDIAISPETARRNARRFRRALPEELRVLILHGVLHLLGYDHETDRGEMDRREHRLRRRLGLT